ncbi:hypothetical protein RUND412_001539 [Rhizina undulata]
MSSCFNSIAECFGFVPAEKATEGHPDSKYPIYMPKVHGLTFTNAIAVANMLDSFLEQDYDACRVRFASALGVGNIRNFMGCPIVCERYGEAGLLEEMNFNYLYGTNTYTPSAERLNLAVDEDKDKSVAQTKFVATVKTLLSYADRVLRERFDGRSLLVECGLILPTPPQSLTAARGFNDA